MSYVIDPKEAPLNINLRKRITSDLYQILYCCYFRGEANDIVRAVEIDFTKLFAENLTDSRTTRYKLVKIDDDE